MEIALQCALFFSECRKYYFTYLIQDPEPGEDDEEDDKKKKDKKKDGDKSDGKAADGKKSDAADKKDEKKK